MTASNLSCSLQENRLTVQGGDLSLSFAGIATAEQRTVEKNARSLPYSEISATREDGSHVAFSVWDGLSAIRISDDSEDTLLSLHGEHWTIRAVKLTAFTDDTDKLTEVAEHNLFFIGLKEKPTGEIFFLEDTLTETAYVLIAETPDHSHGTLSITRPEKRGDFAVSLKTGGYPIVVGACKKGECEALCRAYSRCANHCSKLVTMSNTWGDCHSASRVCESFIEQEIEAAHDIGVDIVQIDDGWQAGNTLYPTLRDEKGNRIFDENYWNLNTERFPNGILPLCEQAARYGIQIGMWFAPASRDCFAMLERDKAVMHRLYKEYGARFIKLDMYQAVDKPHVEKMLEFLHEIYSLGDDVSVQMDVTRYDRLNYLCGREFGTIFVENRYTRTANAFPHRALRNLWDISHYLPSNRFQFELVNPDLYAESYDANDPLAPRHYDMDYLFASVMLSNPLFWMELQFLSEERRAQLAPLLAIWKEHRAALADADVMPIGEKPCGTAHTGFYVSKNGEAKYLLVLREFTKRDTATFVLPVERCDAKVLASNTDIKVTVENGQATVTFAKPRAYAFIELK